MVSYGGFESLCLCDLSQSTCLAHLLQNKCRWTFRLCNEEILSESHHIYNLSLSVTLILRQINETSKFSLRHVLALNCTRKEKKKEILIEKGLIKTTTILFVILFVQQMT